MNMPDMALWVEIVLSIASVLLFGLGVFATISERSIAQSSATKARYLSSSFSGKALIRLLEKRERVIDTSRMLKIIAEVGVSLCTFSLGIFCIDPAWAGILVAVLVTVVAIVFISEIFASALGEKRPERTACYLAPLVTFFTYLLYPFTSLCDLSKRAVSHALKLKPRPEISERDLKAVITDSYDEGAIEKDEHDLIQNSLNFDDKTIERVMTPMAKAVCASDSMSVSQIRQLFIDNNYSRMPFIDHATGEVEGVIFQRDFYEMLLSGSNDVSEAVKPALFFSSRTTASLALKRLQRFRQHMAVVRDSGGRAVGLITVEDLVEELVGEIEDEQDAEDIQNERLKAIRARTRQAEIDESTIAREEDETILPDLKSEDTSEDEDYVESQEGG